jgi:hypothetical protein
MDNSKEIWLKIEILQESLIKSYPGNMSPVNLELKLSPDNLYKVLKNAAGREVLLNYPGGSVGFEVHYKNEDGSLEKVI